MQIKAPHISNRYFGALKFNAFFQILAAAVSSTILCDVLSPLLVAMVAYWAATVIVVIRRPAAPSRGDLLVVQWFFLAVYIPAIIWQLL